MNQFEKEFSHKLKEIAFEFQNINLEWELENCSEYVDLKKTINRIEKRGVQVKKQKEDLEQFVGNFRNQFNKANLLELGEKHIERLLKLLETFNYEELAKSILSAIQLSNEYCRTNQIEIKDVKRILFEDWSGYGNLLMYGFLNNGKSSDDFGEMVIDGIEEFDLTICYQGIKDIEKRERKLPLRIISERIIEFSDTVVRLILIKSLERLNIQNSHESKDNKLVILKGTAFYHNHHDSIEIRIYQRE